MLNDHRVRHPRPSRCVRRLPSEPETRCSIGAGGSVELAIGAGPFDSRAGSKRKRLATERFEMKKEFIGSSFEDFLREEAIYEDVEASAIEKVVACMIEQSMQESRVSKSEMARHMGTSR